MGVIDFSNVASGFEPIEPGTYLANLTSLEMKQGPKGPYIKWEFTLSEGEHANRKVWNNTSLAPQSLWVLKQILKDAFKFSDEELSGNFDTDELTELVGQEVAVVLTNEDYQGQTQTRVVAVKGSEYASDGGLNLV